MKENSDPNNGGPKPAIWDREEENDDTIDKSTFTGKVSGTAYTYIKDGFRNDGSH